MRGGGSWPGSMWCRAATQVVLRFAPGVEVGAVDRSGLDGVRCDHCGTVRSSRRCVATAPSIQAGDTIVTAENPLPDAAQAWLDAIHQARRRH